MQVCHSRICEVEEGDGGNIRASARLSTIGVELHPALYLQTLIRDGVQCGWWVLRGFGSGGTGGTIRSMGRA